jgi:hypothetical protein
MGETPGVSGVLPDAPGRAGPALVPVGHTNLEVAVRATIPASTGLAVCALATMLVSAAGAAVTVLESDRQNMAFLVISDSEGGATDNDRHRTEESDETFGPHAEVSASSEAGSSALGNATQTSFFLDDSFTLIGTFFASATTEEEDAFAEGFGQSRLEVVFEVDTPMLLRLRGSMSSGGIGGGTVLVRVHEGEIYHHGTTSGDEAAVVDVELALIPGIPYSISLHVGGYGQAGVPGGGVPSQGAYYTTAQFIAPVGVADGTAGPSAVTVGPNPLRSGRPLTIATGTTDGVDVVVHDAAGREVRHLGTTGGREAIDWDGRDRTGRAVAPGVYFVRVVGDAVDVSRRVTVLR